MGCNHKNNENTSYLLPIRECSFIGRWLWKGYGFLKQKTLKLPFQILFCFENSYSLFRLILWVLTIALLESYFSGIKVVSDGLHSQKQCIIIPSGMRQKRRQVYCFFICFRDVFDCFCGKAGA
jgi:hypothetical protein